MKKSSTSSIEITSSSTSAATLRLKIHRACDFLHVCGCALRAGEPPAALRKRAKARIERARRKCQSMKLSRFASGQVNVGTSPHSKQQIKVP